MRHGYRYAIRWIIENDDTDFLEDDPCIPSVTACLVADLFGKSEDEIAQALKNELKKQQKRRKTP